MITTQALKKLAAAVGAANLLTAQEDRRCYAYDATNLIYAPEAVAFPGCTEEISQILKLANEYNFPVVPRGAGTGTTGARCRCRVAW